MSADWLQQMLQPPAPAAATAAQPQSEPQSQPSPGPNPGDAAAAPAAQALTHAELGMFLNVAFIQKNRDAAQ